ncbi:glycosyltransferase [Salipiger bermudensis]|uniref:glycosyltransferase n=1 Tax=Salipiger bermudensis TaxID=344736 RepID=UPI001CD68DF9|nr:glycosyltransferase [Salipiger bermudensis]MCA0961824.1 glycosyltransferase [Salipiger bermudensis]
MSGGITFVDVLAPRPYSGAPGALSGLGGTEATLVRIAERLAPARRVTVRQSARLWHDALTGGVRYGGLDLSHPLPEAPGTIVVINSWKVAPRLARLHPGARVIVWQHVFPGRHNRALAPALRAAGVELVCVSATHANWLRGFLGPDAPAIGHIHNPIADDLHPDDTPRDRDLLLFASSPHKGLGQVFRRFEALKRQLPALRLAVADPGYLAWSTGPVPDGVIPLGRLEPSSLIGWMRRALCLFYPQDQFAETFGLVIAEANAVGCPALLHRGLGANDEVASDQSQCIDTADGTAVAAQILQWREATGLRPLAAARPEFRLSPVADQWADLLRPAAADHPRLHAITD